jgi:F-type H+-transporting ATPase subunit a
MLISRKTIQLFIATIFAVLPVVTFANADASHVAKPAHSEVVNHEGTTTKEVVSEEMKAQEERAEFIQHHLLDSHDFHLFSYGKASGHETHIGFPLPVILWEDGIHFFMSSEFHHGEAVAESNGKYFAINHHDGMIYNTDAKGTFNVDEKHHTTNTKPIDFSITKSIVMILIVALLMFMIFRNLGKSYSKNGGIATGVGRFFEPLVLYIRDEIAIPNIGEKHYKKYMSHLLTVFFFIWFLNMFGLTPLGVNVTGNIEITASLAIITYLITTFTANGNYWGHIFWPPGVPLPIKFILVPIEIMSLFIKPTVLMIRLTANITAGHIIILAFVGLVLLFGQTSAAAGYGVGVGAVIFMIFMFFIELLVAFLQAYVFTLLAA